MALTPEERLLAAVESLADTAATAVLSHCDLHAGQPGNPSAFLARKGEDEDPTLFTVSTKTACEPAATGTPGQVRVGVATSTSALPLASTVVRHIVPGQLTTTTCTASQPPAVPAGADHVMVSISVQQPRGCYTGQLQAQAAGVLRKPVVIYLDGLP